MKRFMPYLLWSLFILAFVFASVAAPVALSRAQEQELLNRTVVVNVNQEKEDYLSQAVSFADQVTAFASAQLETRIARNAYPSELSMPDVVKTSSANLEIWMRELSQELQTNLGTSAFDIEELLADTKIEAVLYDSPSNDTKVSYWHLSYHWKSDTDKTTLKEWPVYYVTLYCDTVTGKPYSLEYYYYPFMEFSPSCGAAAYAQMLNMQDRLLLDEARECIIAKDVLAEGGSSIVAERLDSANLCIPLDGQTFCIVKSMYSPTEGWGYLQLMPNSLIKNR